MITFQPDIEVASTKIEWYWKENIEGKLNNIIPEYIVQLEEAYYVWSELTW